VGTALYGAILLARIVGREAAYLATPVPHQQSGFLSSVDEKPNNKAAHRRMTTIQGRISTEPQAAGDGSSNGEEVWISSRRHDQAPFDSGICRTRRVSRRADIRASLWLRTDAKDRLSLCCGCPLDLERAFGRKRFHPALGIDRH